MEKLSSRQRAYLKSLAHPMKPVLQVGKDGITPAVVQGLTDLFGTRELLKVRVLESAPGKAADLGAAMAGRLAGTHLVQVIGRTAVLYRRHPDNPEIVLP